MMTFAIIAGVFFSSCNNNTSEKEQKNIEKKETIGDDYAFRSIDNDLAKKIKEYITTKFLTDADLKAISEEDRNFQLYKVDLNNDGSEEIFVNFGTSYFCGSGGCTVLLLNNKLELITRFSPTQTLYVEKAVENGWRVLLTKTEGSWRKLVYENDTYPTNPTMVEATEESLSDDGVKMFGVESGKSTKYSF